MSLLISLSSTPTKCLTSTSNDAELRTCLRLPSSLCRTGGSAAARGLTVCADDADVAVRVSDTLDIFVLADSYVFTSCEVTSRSGTFWTRATVKARWAKGLTLGPVGQIGRGQW